VPFCVIPFSSAAMFFGPLLAVALTLPPACLLSRCEGQGASLQKLEV
jgi:hypothetical protein